MLVRRPQVPFAGCPIPRPIVIVAWGVRLLRVRSNSPLPATVTDWAKAPEADKTPVKVWVLVAPVGRAAVAQAPVSTASPTPKRRSDPWALLFQTRVLIGIGCLCAPTDRLIAGKETVLLVKDSRLRTRAFSETCRPTGSRTLRA